MTKRIISVLLALVLVLALAMPAMAADLTINGYEGQTYHLWKLFDVISMDGDAVSYKVNDAWKTFFSEGNPGAAYVDLDANGLITWKKANSEDDAKALAAAALQYATAEGTKIEPVKTVIMDEPAEGENVAAASATVTGMEMGYYLLDSNVGSLLALKTTNAEISDKNTVTTHEKWIVDEGKVKKNDALIGEDVKYEVTIHAQANLVTLKLEDTMENTLSFNNDIVVKVGEAVVAPSNYEIKTGNQTSATFEVIFTKAYLDTLTGPTDIVVTYSGKLLSSAVVHEPNDNTSKIYYGNDYSIESQPEKTQTYTFDINVKKVDGSDNNIVLAGVEFVMKDENGVVYNFGDAVDTGDVRVYTVSEGTNTELVTNSKGTFTVKGVDKGTYYLHETETLAGYNKLDAPIVIDVDANGNVTIKNEQNESVPAEPVVVENNKGTKLPETGGIGTTIFYLVGGLMMAAAVVLLVAKKRTVNE